MIRQTNKDPDFHQWDLIDLDTGKPIEGVRWADDKKGEYAVSLFHENGKIKVGKDAMGNFTIRTETRKGNIRWVMKEMYLATMGTTGSQMFVRAEDTMGRD